MKTTLQIVTLALIALAFTFAASAGGTFQSPVSPIVVPTTTPTIEPGCPLPVYWKTCNLDTDVSKKMCTWRIPVFERVEDPTSYLCENIPERATCTQYWATDSRTTHFVTCEWNDEIKTPVAPTAAPTPASVGAESLHEDLWMGVCMMWTNGERITRVICP